MFSMWKVIKMFSVEVPMHGMVVQKPGRAISVVISPVIAGAIWPAMKIYTATLQLRT